MTASDAPPRRRFSKPTPVLNAGPPETPLIVHYYRPRRTKLWIGVAVGIVVAMTGLVVLFVHASKPPFTVSAVSVNWTAPGTTSNAQGTTTTFDWTAIVSFAVTNTSKSQIAVACNPSVLMGTTSWVAYPLEAKGPPHLVGPGQTVPWSESIDIPGSGSSDVAANCSLAPSN